MDKVEGYLEVGLNDDGEVVVNHPDLKPDENGIGHIVFSPDQARNLAALLNKHAADSERAAFDKAEAARIAAIPEVDRSKRCMLSGKPEADDHRDIQPSTGMQKDYVVLCPDERSKGFVRPVRSSYVHRKCGGLTTMGRALAETYARDPKFYSGTFCATCRSHFPLDQFVWEGSNEVLGS